MQDSRRIPGGLGPFRHDGQQLLFCFGADEGSRPFFLAMPRDAVQQGSRKGEEDAS